MTDKRIYQIMNWSMCTIFGTIVAVMLIMLIYSTFFGPSSLSNFVDNHSLFLQKAFAISTWGMLGSLACACVGISLFLIKNVGK